MVNLFALRATDPRELARSARPVGSGAVNDTAIFESADRCGLVICAWGTHGAYMERGPMILSALLASEYAPKVRHLGLTKDGHPRHPLYLRGDTKPQPFPPTP